MTKATIKDVAETADVSISTVSRYVNSTKAVSPNAAERIRLAIEQLQYIPNANARNLKMQSTNVLGMIITDISNVFYSSLCKSLESVLYRQGYSLMIFSSDEDPIRERSQIELLREKCVDGIIISPTGKTLSNYLIDSMKSGIPIAIVDRFFDVPHFDFVVENNTMCTYILTKHMLDLGHRKIAFVRGLEGTATGIARCEGYIRALNEYGIECDDALIFSAPQGEDGIKKTLECMLDNLGDVTSVLLANPPIFEEFIKMIKVRGICVPDDLSYAAITLAGRTEFSPVKLTCALQNPSAIGTQVGEQMIKRLSSKRRYPNYKGETIEVNMAIEIGDSVVKLV